VGERGRLPLEILEKSMNSVGIALGGDCIGISIIIIILFFKKKVSATFVGVESSRGVEFELNSSTNRGTYSARQRREMTTGMNGSTPNGHNDAGPSRTHVAQLPESSPIENGVYSYQLRLFIHP
jgi:hypothetical protein